MTREEVICVIRQRAEESGHVPTMNELLKAKRISQYDVRKHFGVYAAALHACGLQGRGPGYEVSMRQLFMDWAEVARRAGRVPTVGDYELHSRYSLKPLMRQFGAWPRVAAGMAQYARENGLEQDGKDILEVVATHLEAQRKDAKTLKWSSPRILRPGLKKGEPIYGTPTVEAHLMLAPTNEQGVVFLFGAVARSLGFVVLRIQTEYPDCEALREMETDHWQRVKIEFEYESRNFLLHGHRADQCNLIVCWRHNWAESPLEVIELKTALRQQ
jgi:Homing endonuclease associated repeat